jgi:hypothetical protein
MNYENLAARMVFECAAVGCRTQPDTKFLFDFTLYTGFFAFASVELSAWEFPSKRMSLIAFSLGYE